MHDFRMGSKVTFADASATTSKDEMVAASGVVNGPPILGADDEVQFVPVFAKRDNGREATTIFVHVNNVLDARLTGE